MSMTHGRFETLGIRTAVRALSGVVAGVALSQAAFAGQLTVDETIELFNNSLEERDEGRLYHAIEHLEAILAVTPTAQRVRIELAVAYYRALIFDEAERLANEVLGLEDIDDEVRTNVENFLALVEKRREQAAARRHQLKYDVSLGLGYDDNANQSPEDFLGSTAVVSQEKDGLATISGRATHTYVKPGTINVADYAGVISVKSTASYFRKEYFDETEVNVDVVSVSTAPRLTIAKKLRVELPLQLDYIRLGDDNLAVFSSLNPNVTLLTEYGEVKVKGIMQQREYTNSSSESREGARTGVEVSWANRMFDNKLTAQVALESVLQHAEVDRQEYDSLKLKASGKWSFNEAWAARAKYTYQRRDYRGDDPFVIIEGGSGGRETRQHALQLGGEYTVLDWGMWSDWVLGANVTYTDVEANASVYEYDRLQYNVTASRQFK